MASVVAIVFKISDIFEKNKWWNIPVVNLLSLWLTLILRVFQNG